MSAALHLADETDLDRLLPMVAAYHSLEKIDQSDDVRRNSVQPLLQGSPHGAVWLIGPRKSPVGYIVISFGWSVALGGMDGSIDEFYIRENVRGRGMGTEVLAALLPQLARAGIKALHLKVAQDNASARKLYSKRGFELRERYNLMTWHAA
ncbi:MAG: GNAT family N-acetyltransferase [Rhodobacter sp.]|nr:GNAT family N-acetyltransferase [Rhodobacter sp.]